MLHTSSDRVSHPGMGIRSMDMTPREAIDTLTHLGRQGLIVSLCYGPCGDKGCLWTVSVLNPIGEEFDEPYAAHSFEHAVAIAATEVEKRGWVLG